MIIYYLFDMERSFILPKESAFKKSGVSKYYPQPKLNVGKVPKKAIEPQQKLSKSKFAFGHSEIKNQIKKQTDKKVTKLNPETHFERIGKNIMKQTEPTLISKGQS